MTDGIPIIYSDLIPEGTAYLGSFDHGVRTWPVEPLTFRQFPYRSAPHLPPEVQRERTRGLDYLAGLLDRLCERNGISPDVWRAPHMEQRWRENRMAYITEARYAMTLVDPRKFAVVTDA